MGNKTKELPKYYGQGGRLQSPAAPELVASAYSHDCRDADVLFKGISYADIAHAMMLIKKGIVPENEGRALISGLLELHGIKDEEFEINPELGDVYNSREAQLRASIGPTAGWLHAGRPRREAVNAGYLLKTRELILVLLKNHLALLETFLNRAEEFIDVIMPDQTYLHHAHPTTFGHYLLTFAFPMERDIERLKLSYKWFNRSNAGSGSVNGSRLPIDREMLRNYLGFDDISLHTRDAMWQPDPPIELISNIVALLVNINRFSEELQIWSSSEFDMIELPDEFCRASVIMPQKKNPYPMCYIRGLTGDMLGKTASIAAVGKTYSGNPDSRTFVYGELSRAIIKTDEAVVLFAGLMKKIQPNRERMLELVKQGYSNATDLADILMTELKIDYRTSHQIMGMVVRKALERKIKGFQITADLVAECFKEITGKSARISNEIIEVVTDPARIVETRKTLGGAGRNQIRSMIDSCRSKMVSEREWVDRKLQKHYHSLAGLMEEATEFAGN